MKLSYICKYRSEKIDLKDIKEDEYVSTDNMLPNFSGIGELKSFPNVDRVSKFYKNDILLSNIRPYFKKMILSDKNSGCSSDVLVIETTSKDVNPKFLYYRLKSDDFFDYVVLTSKGTKMPRGDKTAIMNFELEVPKLEIQNKIVKIVESIDKKIKLNNEINNNLYELSNLNHSEFIKLIKNNDECCFKDLHELGKIVMGQSPKGESYNYEKDGLPLINGAADYEDGYLKAQKYTSSPTKICNKDDLLFCIRATIGLLVICDKEYCLGRGVAGIININTIYKEFAYHLISSSIEDFKRMATGSVIVGISRENIENILVKIPSRQEIEKYHLVQKPIFDRIENIRQENKKLKDLRDTLLPKLMNGEIDLDNIEI